LTFAFGLWPEPNRLLRSLALSDYYKLRRSTITDAGAGIGFALGLVLAAAFRWSILVVNFRHGDFAGAVLQFAKTMLVWGLVGGAVGAGAGVIGGWAWQRVHSRRRNTVQGPTSRVQRNSFESDPSLAVDRPSSAATIPDSRFPIPASIRIDDSGFPADAFLALAERVWHRGYDAARAAPAIEKTVNVGAWDGTRLVGAVRVLSDGYFFATVPEILVDPAYRRRGIGRALMNRALALSPSGTLVIGATTESVGFFQRMGCELAPMGFVMKSEARVQSPESRGG